MPRRELRMTPTFLHVLLALSGGPRHGYALMHEIDERSSGLVRLGPSSLYYALERLEDEQLVREADAPAAKVRGEPHADRRRYFRLTREGRRRLEAETAVLADIVSHARAQGLLR